MSFDGQNNPNQFMNDFNRMKNDLKNTGKMIAPIVGGIILIILAMTTFYTVEPDEEAVVIRFGKYTATNPPGLHFKLPFGVDKVIKVKTKRVLQAEFGFRTRNSGGRRTSYSSNNYSNESLMLTGDLNVADVEWAVQYQISDPFKFLFQTIT